MDHRELKQIKARRGFVESPTGGFVRDPKWMAPRLAHMARVRQELSTRLAGIDLQLGVDAQQLIATLPVPEPIVSPSEPIINLPESRLSGPELSDIDIHSSADPPISTPPPIWPAISKELRQALLQWAAETGQHQKPPDTQPEPSTPTKLSWRERIHLAVVISWRLLCYGTIESIRDLTHG